MKWHEELHEQISRFALIYCLNTQDILGFLSITLWGTMAMKGYSDEFARKTFDRMFDNFKTKKEEFKNLQNEKSDE